MKQELLPAWVGQTNGFKDVVISSRIRLARNLKGISFPSFADEKQLATVNQQVQRAIQVKTDLGPLTPLQMEE